jgi:hypothetical protein
MNEAFQELFNSEGFGKWTVEDDSVLISPNGHRIEYDGTSPDGEQSPLLVLGMI